MAPKTDFHSLPSPEAIRGRLIDIHIEQLSLKRLLKVSLAAEADRAALTPRRTPHVVAGAAGHG